MQLSILLVFLSENVVNDLPGGLFNGFVRRIDDFPVPVSFDKVPDIFDLGKNIFEVALPSSLFEGPRDPR